MIHPAASLVLVWPERQTVLMGQRGAAAVFMASKYVFPGGRVDPEDRDGAGLSPQCRDRLARHLPEAAPGPGALVAAARRELAEESGLTLAPEASLRFIFRAITPPGAPRRFDARFFLGAAQDVLGDPTDFSAAGSELSRLAWVGLKEARSLDLPFITEIILAEVRAILQGQDQPGVPFFDNSGPVPTFRRL